MIYEDTAVSRGLDDPWRPRSRAADAEVTRFCDALKAAVAVRSGWHVVVRRDRTGEVLILAWCSNWQWEHLVELEDYRRSREACVRVVAGLVTRVMDEGLRRTLENEAY